MRKKHPVYYLYNQARYRAKERGIKFSIKRSDIEIPKRCPILGIKLESNYGRRKDNSYSLDRVNNNKGYVKGNVRVISWQANRFKSNLTKKLAQRFIDYIDGKI